jgi:hypothetical protein
MDLLQTAIKCQHRSPSRLLLIAEVFWFTWRERNSLVYQSNSATAPLIVILKTVYYKVQALLETTLNLNKQVCLTLDSESLDACIQTLLPTQPSFPLAALPNYDSD